MSTEKRLVFDKDIKLEKAREFIELFMEEGSAFQITHHFDITETAINSYIFRGQSNKNWELLPSAHRCCTALKGFTPQPPNHQTARNNKDYLRRHLHAELRAIQVFMKQQIELV